MAGGKPRLMVRNVLVTLLGIYLFWLVASTGWSYITAYFVKIDRLQKEVIEETLPIEGIMIRDETVLVAPGVGEMNWTIGEGERVRLQASIGVVKIATLNDARPIIEAALHAPVTGLLYYQVDGLESIYTPDFIKELDPNKVSSMQPHETKVADKSTVEKGQAVGKIVNNHAPSYIWGKTKVTAEAIQQFEEGKKIKARFGEDIFDVKINKAWKRESEIEFLMQANIFPTNLNLLRNVKLNLIVHRFEGYTIPEKALVNKKGKPGVYVAYKERVYWKNVEIIDEIHDKLVIKGLPENTSYIINPRWTREGRYLPY